MALIPRDADSHLLQAEKAEDREDWVSADYLYRAAAFANPDHYNDLGQFLVRRGRADEALHMYEAEMSRGNVGVALNYANLLSEQGDTATAERVYQGCIDRGKTTALNNPAQLYTNEGRLAKAEEYYRAAIATGDNLARRNFACFLIEEGRSGEALELLSGIEVGADTDVQIDRADLCLLLGHWEQAICIVTELVARGEIAEGSIDLVRQAVGDEVAVRKLLVEAGSGVMEAWEYADQTRGYEVLDTNTPSISVPPTARSRLVTDPRLASVTACKVWNRPKARAYKSGWDHLRQIWAKSPRFRFQVTDIWKREGEQETLVIPDMLAVLSDGNFGDEMREHLTKLEKDGCCRECLKAALVRAAVYETLRL